MMNITAVPDDILDDIFNHTYSNDTLARLCIVNHRFFDLAAPLLWRNIVLEFGESGSRCADVLDVLRQRHQSRDYGRLVKTVCVRESDRSPSYQPVGCLIDVADILTILEQCPSMKTFKLCFTGARPTRMPPTENSPLHFADPKSQLPTGVVYPKLQEIEIVSSADVGVETLLQSLVMLSPNLKRLTWRSHNLFIIDMLDYELMPAHSASQQVLDSRQLSEFSWTVQHNTAMSHNIPFNPPRHIRLPPFDQITEPTLNIIIKSCPNLSYLHLRRVVITDPSTIESLALLPNLRSLHLDSFTLWPFIPENSWLPAARACSQLTHLALHGPCGVSADLVVELFAMLPCLMKLELDGDHVEADFVELVREAGEASGVVCTQMMERLEGRYLGTMLVERKGRGYNSLCG
ncbi:hypothetical protein BC938DRAFT_470956 [Jimgerdemannia flammicorona]|uniref:F-box domain-containing protein n=1 Tax=Jimgerdemannia flammicorona TaxID=994334 RepID=A0A433QV17_9FUNG|nr:hypothetical protein BC938DRAFT_470956 [Jimgerdemannia flammicorona]